MVEPHQITSQSEAVAVASRLTGLDELSEKISARFTTVTEDYTPFLSKQLIGSQAWQVEFENVSLRLESAIPGYQDQFQRKFIVLIDRNTGQLLSITSKFEGKDPDMRPIASGESAEEQLRAEEETYHGLPDEEPKIGFLDALDIVLSDGIGSPFLAKEIYASYVMHSRMDSEPRPVWIVTLRGLPPMPARGPYGDSIPVWQRNHMRNIIDAMTGESLFATNSPQPD